MNKTRPILTRFVAPILSLACAGTLWAGYTPVPITFGSYNADVVVEKTATPVLKIATDASVDTGTNNTAATWMEAGFDLANPGNGLPPAGTTFTAVSNANYSFTFPPSYTAPNGILIDTLVKTGTFTFTAPAAYNLLSFLSSGGNGGDVVAVRINHQDGTHELGSFGSPDWFFGTSNVAFVANERVGSTVNFTYANVNSGNPRLYFRDIALTNTTSPITNVVLTYSSGPASSHNCVMAVSGATTPGGPVGPIAVTGYTYDFVVEATAAKRGRLLSTNIVDGTNLWATSQSMDNTANTANSWYERGYNFNNPNGSGIVPPYPGAATQTGIPTAGATVTNASGSHAYELAPDFTSNNVVYLSTVITNASITPVTPTAAGALSFLTTAGNGPAAPVVIITHDNGASQTNSITVPDWFNTTAPIVISANGRVAVDTGQFDIRNTGLPPRVFRVDLPLAETVSPVTNITVLYTNTAGRVAIFGIASATGVIPPIFTAQPVGTNTYEGDTVVFSAIVTGASSYQWQKGTNGVFVNLADGGNVSGATTATLTLSPVGLADTAEYRLVASNAGGSDISVAVTLNVLSLLTDVTTPGDPTTSFGGGDAGAEPVANSINNTTTKWLNFGGNGGSPFLGPVGMTVSTPGVGRTVVSGLRFFTANDDVNRDPADYKLEGSNNGGLSYALISSNALALPLGRNGAGQALNPITHNVQQVMFANTNSYKSYRLTITRVRNPIPANSMQIGEIEFLGVADTNTSPDISLAAEVRQYLGSPASLAATITGDPIPVNRWQRESGTPGVYTNLTDGGVISGSQTATLTISPADFSHAGNYRIISTNIYGAATNVVSLAVLTTLTDVTAPSDTVTAYGDQSLGFWGAAGNPVNVIDDTFTTYVNGGSGLNAPAGFAPFGGPAGFVVTPALGNTVVNAVRFYTGTDAHINDPADYTLEGSNNGGASYTLISSGAVALPDTRNDVQLGLDPLTSVMREIRFANNQAFTSYRLSHANVKNNATANSVRLGEVELLGAVQPTLTIIDAGGGSLTISSSYPGTLQSATNLTPTVIWANEGPISGSVNISPTPGEPIKFYRVVVP